MNIKPIDLPNSCEDGPDSSFNEEFFAVMNNPNYENLLGFVRRLQQKTSERTFPLERFLENNQFMIKLVIKQLLRDDLPLMQYYVCWILSNLLTAENSFPFDQIIFENGGLENLIWLIANNSAKSEDLYVQIVWALGNFFASENLPFDEIVGKVYPLSQLILSKMTKDNEEMSIWTVSNMLKGKIPIKEIEFNELLFIFLKVLYRSDNENISLDIYSVLSKYICISPSA